MYDVSACMHVCMDVIVCIVEARVSSTALYTVPSRQGLSLSLKLATGGSKTQELWSRVSIHKFKCQEINICNDTTQIFIQKRHFYAPCLLQYSL